MPIYAFACQACGHAFDNLQKMSDPDPATCPACGAAEVKRQLTAPSFRLAGAGWYETDFKKDGDRKRNLAGDGGESKNADTAASSSDSSGKSGASEKGEGASGKDSAGSGASTKLEPKAVAKTEATPASKPAAPASKDS